MDNNQIAHICQNCGSNLIGKYCHNCGQKSSAAFDRSLKYILEHFAEELFVWDSRFWRTVKYLFTRPGYLTHEYISGRIQKYSSPLKLFLFTSFVLFFIMIKADPDQYNALVNENISEDDIIRDFILEQKSESGEPEELYISNFNDQLNDNVTLYILSIMFLFSLVLSLVYFSKKIYFSEHIVFTLHFFTFVLWSFLFSVITAEISDLFVFFFLYILPAAYLLIAIKKAYHKSLLNAILAGIFLSFCYWVLITIWVLGTIFLSAIRA